MSDMKRAKRPLELSVRLAGYIVRNRLRRRTRFPLVTMLEPLEMCNLACVGCGRIREYKPVIDKMMSVQDALDAVNQSGAPIVSVAGGEPTIHPKIDEILNGLVEQKYFVYCCTNGLLLERLLAKVPPSKYLCWVVHLDGMEEKHDESVARGGVFKKAVQGIELALDRGYRVCTNTTVFRNSDTEDLWEMFRLVGNLGVEGSMISPGYEFEDAPDQELFLTRHESQGMFKRLLDPAKTAGMKFYNNPLYLNFLQGSREVPVHGLVQPHVHHHGLAQALLSAGRRPHPRRQRAVRRAALGPLRRGQGPKMRQLHDALRIRVGDHIPGGEHPQGLGHADQVGRRRKIGHHRRLSSMEQPC